MKVEHLDTYIPSMARRAADFVRKNIKNRESVGSRFEAAISEYTAREWERIADDCQAYGAPHVIHWAMREMWYYASPGGASQGRFPTAHTLAANAEYDARVSIARELLTFVGYVPCIELASAFCTEFDREVDLNRAKPKAYTVRRHGRFGYRITVEDYDGRVVTQHDTNNKAELAAWRKANPSLREIL